MPKFAFFKPADPAPQSVLGWYDTDNFVHLNLPDDEALIKVSDEDWAARLEDPAGWAVVDGNVVPKEKI
jgi:hypothetical protein